MVGLVCGMWTKEVLKTETSEKRNSMVALVVDVTYILRSAHFEHWDEVRSSILIMRGCRAGEFTW